MGFGRIEKWTVCEQITYPNSRVEDNVYYHSSEADALECYKGHKEMLKWCKEKGSIKGYNIQLYKLIESEQDE